MELFFLDQVSSDRIIRHFRNPGYPNDIEFPIDENSRASDVVQNCIKSGMLVEEHANELTELYHIREGMLNDRFIGVVYMILTDGCNLRCTYCFEDAHLITGFSSTLMSCEVAEAAIETLARLNKKYPIINRREITVQFYGGEPLLNFSALQATTMKVESLKSSGHLPENTELAMVTNGTLITQSVAEFLREHNISVGVSIDGYKSVHNKYRIQKSGKGSFKDTINGYKCLVDNGVKSGLSCTLTPEVVNDFDAVIEFLQNDLGLNQGLTFNILHFTPHIKLPLDYYDKAAKCILKAFPVFRDCSIWEDRMMRKAESFANRQIMYSDCAAIGHQLVISPDGKIGVCQDFIKPRRYFSSSVFDSDFDPYQEPNFISWQKRSPLFMESCFDCEALGICGGGCPASAEAFKGSMWAIDERICPHSKGSLEWLIWDLFSKMEN